MSKGQVTDLYSKFSTDLVSRSVARLRHAGAYGFSPELLHDTSFAASEILYQGQRLLNFGSNDYLGLTHDPSVISAACEATSKYGTGSSGSPLLNGTTTLHKELERRISNFLGTSSAVLFGSGFLTNLAAMATLAKKQEVILADESCHASILEGLHLSSARSCRFDHNDSASLCQSLKHCRDSEARLVVVEGVYSIEGDIADLPEICRISKLYGARIFVDDAHGIGVLGVNGRGSSEFLGVENDVDIISGTFSKTFATQGGFISGSEEMTDYLRHHARPYIFSASLPPSALATAIAALEIVQSQPQRRSFLLELSLYARRKISQANFTFTDGITPTIGVRFAAPKTIFEQAQYVSLFCNKLLKRGFLLNPIVGQASGSPRVRINIMAVHQKTQIDMLVNAMSDVRAELNSDQTTSD